MDILTLKDTISSKLKSSPKILTYFVVVSICVVILILMNTGEDQDAEILDFPEAQTEYATALERQLEAIISKIDGVGKVNVMVTVESTVTFEFAEDISNSASGKNTETVIIGNNEALIKRIDNPKVAGVLVICDGGDSIIIKEKIIKAVSTVLDISSNKVYITK